MKLQASLRIVFYEKKMSENFTLFKEKQNEYWINRSNHVHCIIKKWPCFLFEYKSIAWQLQIIPIRFLSFRIKNIFLFYLVISQQNVKIYFYSIVFLFFFILDVGINIIYDTIAHESFIIIKVYIRIYIMFLIAVIRF